MIEFAPDLVSLHTNLQRFMMTSAAGLPEHTREALLEAAGHPSPVDRVVNSAEALYAAKSDLDADGRVIAAQLAQFAAMNGWHGMSERGLKIAQAMQRIGGYAAPPGSTWPSAEDDPEPLERFLDTPVTDPAAPPAPAPEPE